MRRHGLEGARGVQANAEDPVPPGGSSGRPGRPAEEGSEPGRRPRQGGGCRTRGRPDAAPRPECRRTQGEVRSGRVRYRARSARLQPTRRPRRQDAPMATAGAGSGPRQGPGWSQPPWWLPRPRRRCHPPTCSRRVRGRAPGSGNHRGERSEGPCPDSAPSPGGARWREEGPGRSSRECLRLLSGRSHAAGFVEGPETSASSSSPGPGGRASSQRVRSRVRWSSAGSAPPPAEVVILATSGPGTVKRP